MSIQSLKEKNQYPIIFIGSGMSRRFIEASPNWLTLLEEYWRLLNNEVDFYSHLNELRQVVISNTTDMTEERITFEVNSRVASEIQKSFDDAYNQDNSLMPDLSPKDVYMHQLSPFKVSLSKRFSKIQYKEGSDSEIALLGKLLSKARIIITTNYDSMIENLLDSENKSADIFVGNTGFFKETTGWGELYKIHGTSSDPASIIITAEDYESYDENSILLNAKLLSSLVDAPILFLGYSLSDENVRSLLRTYAKNMPTDVSQNSDRITIVEYVPDEKQVVENVEHDPVLGITYTRIRTDNFSSLFEQVAEINQGVSPAYIRKYQQEFKQIIEVKGREGKLDTFLTYANNIDDLTENQRLQNTAIAIGDRSYLFVIPTLVDYLTDYLNESDNTAIQVAARFLAQQQLKANLPYLRLLRRIESAGDIGLTKDEKRKIRTRIQNTPALDGLIASTGIPKALANNLNAPINDIWNDQAISEATRIKWIIKGIRNHSDEIKSFILATALPRFIANFQSGVDSNGIRTAYRRLFLAYDLLVNGPLESKKIAQVE